MALPPEQLDGLIRLLESEDTTYIVQGVELTAALDDIEVFRALEARGFGPRSHRNPSDGRSARVFRELARVGLVANHPEREARAQVDGLTVRAGSSPYRPLLEAWPLAWLANLPELRRLDIEVPPGADLEALGGCSALESLTLHLTEEVDDLSALATLTGLRRLTVRGSLRSLQGLAAHDLDELSVDSGNLVTTEGVAQRVGTLTLARPVAASPIDLSGLRASTVDRLVLRGPASLDGLEGASIRELRLQWLNGHLPRVAGLTSLELCARVTSERQPQVVDLVLQDVVPLPPLADRFPAVRALTLNAPQLTDVEGLVGLPELREVRIVRGLVRSLDALARLPLERLCLDVAFHHADALPEAQLVGPDGEPTDELTCRASTLSLRGMGALRGLRVLRLAHCFRLRSLAGLEGTGIEVLDLRMCTGLDDVAAIEQMPALRHVAVWGTPWARRAFPPTSAEISHSSDPPFVR